MDGGHGVCFGLEVLHAHQLLAALLCSRPRLQRVSRDERSVEF